MSSGMRKALSLLALAAGCGLLAASALASVNQAPPADTLRWSLSVDIDYVDPALAYYGPSWALEYATGAMLFNYPDAPAPRGSRLVPEVAAGFPRISSDGRTYTFRLKKTYRFSNGRPVRAANFVRAFQRARNRRPETPARRFIADVVHFAAPRSDRLRIRLRAPAGDILARLAMPFFMAVPSSTPDVVDGIRAPVVSAGPYFIRQWTQNRRIVLERNRHYRGPRPQRVERILVDIGLPLETINWNIDRGRTDLGDIPPGAHAELGERFGVRRRSPGRYFVNPTPTVLYLAFNHDRRLFGGPTPFGNVPLKRAVNYAIDRTAMLWQRGAHAGVVHDQLIPRTLRGFTNVDLYPRRPDLEKARELARGNLRGGTGIMHCPNRSPNPAVCQVVQANLRQIGLNLDIRVCRQCSFEPVRGEPIDLRLEAWHTDYLDPYDFIQLVDGATIRPRRSVNLSYFDHPEYNRRIRQARAVVGPQRYRAFNALDHDLMQKAAPVAVYGSPNDRHYVSARTGCYHHHPVYGFDFPAICLRR
jgi:peptide/nickel transport system substrate-binding protein